MAKQKVFDCPACEKDKYTCVVCGDTIPGFCKEHYINASHRCGRKSQEKMIDDD